MTVLHPIAENLWLVDGPGLSVYGLPFSTRMAIVRLRDGGLWLWSPIQLDEDLRREVRSLGEPRYAVEPNKLHHRALAAWVDAWPGLQLFAPPGLAKKRSDLRFTGELTSDAPVEWRGEIDQVCVEGSFVMTEVLFFHRRSGTCLVGDLIQKHDEESLNTWEHRMMEGGGVLGRNGSTPRDWRLTFIHRHQARSAISRAISWSPLLVKIRSVCPRSARCFAMSVDPLTVSVTRKCVSVAPIRRGRVVLSVP